MLWKKEHHNAVCVAVERIVAALLFLASIAALAGVYKSHFLSAGATFGTTSGSLSILSFAVSVTLWSKWMKCCCSHCSKK